MGTIAHVDLADHLQDTILDDLRARAVESAGELVRPGVDVDDESSLFADHDAIAGRGWGYFRFDEEECRSRRLDMRTPLDFDPGPIPMEEAEPDAEAVTLEF